MITEVCHLSVPGPWITSGATEWGEHVEEHGQRCEEVKEGCAAVRERAKKRHQLMLRIDFHLHGRRLTQNDLDNMIRDVLNAALGPGRDQHVWKVDAQKVAAPDEDSQRTELWFFDLGG